MPPTPNNMFSEVMSMDSLMAEPEVDEATEQLANGLKNVDINTEAPKKYKDEELEKHKKNRRFKQSRHADKVLPPKKGTDIFIERGEHYDEHVAEQRANICIQSQNMAAYEFDYMSVPFSTTTTKALDRMNFQEPTPVQQVAVPFITHFKTSDFVIRAPMGYGKTFAFLIPIVEEVWRQKQAIENTTKRYTTNSTDPYAVIVAPTRELATQLFRDCKTFCEQHNGCVRVAVSVGKQLMKATSVSISEGADILFVTHGRLIHHFMNNQDSVIKLGYSNLKFIVLDEADTFCHGRRESDKENRLEMRAFFKNMIEDRNRKGLSSSEVQSILIGSNIDIYDYYKISDFVRKDYIGIQVGASSLPKLSLVHKVIFVEDSLRKIDILGDMLITMKEKTLIFSNEKLETERVAFRLNRLGVSTIALSSNMTQAMRAAAIKKFDCGDRQVLVASDVGSLGLNYPKLELVINLNIPECNSQVSLYNRLGRVGRFGNNGKVYHMYCPYEDYKKRDVLRNILIDQNAHVPEYLLKTAENNNHQ
ncbi:unnamed protein product [Bursaphelenchus okinawaensis]|uniref:RNA helicase n=1 Tax=Bursaphelenchus okinawaensis TaxID=465554 RepID=A0A811LJR0_9BILA|nr:unnamed protein product [Bursaphelenchus okinawaensis]CAG9123733.1 unnamed protein product [Bursaphelenchus okinawaensis]